jgi:hypothetical protein
MNTEPTEAQKKAGNYTKEHRFLHGMRLSIENKAGSTRKGVGEDGKPWESKLNHDYGYIRETLGKDKDHIDVFLGPQAEDTDKVYVIDQNNKEGGFDEHKVMLGFKDSNDAYQAYHSNYPEGWDGFDAITQLDLPSFKKWAYSGNKAGKRKAISELRNFKSGGSVDSYFSVGDQSYLGGPKAPEQQASAAPAGGFAPTYDMNDPAQKAAYEARLQTAGAGRSYQGAKALLGDVPLFTPGSGEGMGEHWNVDKYKALADQIGFDTSKYVLDPGAMNHQLDSTGTGIFGFEKDLNEALKDYHQVSGLSTDWDSRYGDRTHATTLYKDEGGVWTPVSESQFLNLPRSGGFIRQNAGPIGGMLSIFGGALGGAALAGAGSAAGAGVAQGVGQAAAQGATQAASQSIYQTIANAIGAGPWWSGLSPAVQGALGGAAQGALSSGLTGGNPLQGALMGGLGGGLAPSAGSAIQGATGLPAWAARGLVGAGMGGLGAGISGGNPWLGAIGGGANSLASTGLRELGLPSSIASLGGRAAGQAAAGAFAPDQRQQQNQYYQQRRNQATPELSAVMQQSYLPSNVQAGPKLYKKGGSVQPLDACSYGHYAEGGSVEEDTGPYIGYRGRRREANNDRRGAQEMPLQALRGAITGTLGFGGDMEELARSAANFLGADVDPTAALPTGDFYRDILPGAPTSAAGRAASGAGSALGTPLSGPVLGGVRAAKAAAPAVRAGALRAAENAMAPRTLSPQAGAVKLPGGDWLELGGVSSTVEDLQGASFLPETKKWVGKKIPNYLRNQLGTPSDPLIELEKQGISHLTPEQLNQMAGVTGNYTAGTPDVWRGDSLHKELTGRSTKSPWEAASDALIMRMSHNDATAMLEDFDNPIPPWMQGDAAKSKEYYELSAPAMEDTQNLGFNHIIDYLNSATEAGAAAKLYGRAGFGGEEGERMNRLLARNLDIDPDKLSMMAFPDVIRKTAEWNKMLEESKRLLDMNKGVKNVMKSYDDTGHQWVELDPAGLNAEGEAMGHCVGGYCSSVERGDKRILSLRSKDGQPHVTVELGKPDTKKLDFNEEDGLDRFFESNASNIAHESTTARMQREHPSLAPESDEYSDIYAELFQDEAGKAVEIHNANIEKLKAQKVAELPWEIRQIKGKGNLKPADAYLPAVQDLVRNMGPWSEDIRDFRNTGLVRYNDNFSAMSPGYLERQFGITAQPNPGYYTKEELLNKFRELNPNIEVDEEILQRSGID